MLPNLRLPILATSALMRGRTPKQLIIQLTDSCNAHCPQCGMQVGNVFPRSKLDEHFVRQVLRTAAQRGAMSVSITGGEPLLYAEQVFNLLAFARGLGIRYTRTGTNGFMLRDSTAPDFDSRVAQLAIRIRQARLHTFWISLDSADPQVHENARGLPGVVAGIRRALPILRDYGIYPAVNLGINRRMGLTPVASMVDPEVFSRQVRTGLREFYRSVIALGFTMANVCYPMDFGNGDPASAYRATSTDPVVHFSRAERAILFRIMAEVTEEFRPQIRAFSPLSSLRALSSQHAGDITPVPACRGGVDFFYISAAGRLLYPCGFRGNEPMGDPTLDVTWATDNRADCQICDWECFRDPSFLTAPITRFAWRPDRALRWVINEPSSAKTWWRDWQYYAACGFFSSAKPPRPERLARFA